MNTASDHINIMVDLETLGTRPGCKILSIGAVTFCTHPEPQVFFYQKINSRSYPPAFHEDLRTLRWWDAQSAEARDEAFSGKDTATQALDSFADWLKSFTGKEIILWGNGADFDNAILAEAYQRMGIPLPWNFYDNRCYRTLKNLFSQIPYTKPKMAHNALEDARAQAVHAEAIVDTIGIRV